MATDSNTDTASTAWEGFGILQEDPDEPTLTSVAEAVLEAYDISKNNSGGGTLANVDLKRVNAYNALKASLLDEFAQEGGGLHEMMINADGEAYFYEVGDSTSELAPYYSIKSSSYLQSDVGVMITGGKPKQTKKFHPWYTLVGDGSNSTVYDTTAMNTACTMDIHTFAVVTYNDPIRHGDSSTWWMDGIDEIFEPESAFERIIGYCWRITPPEDLVSSTTVIKKQSQSTIPILLCGDTSYELGKTGDSVKYPDMGTLKKRNVDPTSSTLTGNCTIFEDDVTYCGDTTVSLQIDMNEGITYTNYRGTKVNKFDNVNGLFCSGIVLGQCYGIPKDGKQRETNTAANTDLFIAASDTNRSFIKLSEGIDYVTLYKEDIEDGEDDYPCFQFANNLRYDDNATVGTGVSFYIHNDSTKLQELFNNSTTGTATVFPKDKTAGILVEQVWAQVTLDTPCFTVIDPRGNASDIASALTVEVMVMSILDDPAPIAVNGTLVDQESGVKDNNPTTVQDFEDTDLELAQLEASTGRTLHLNLASLDEDTVVTLSQNLYDFMMSDDGTTWSHTCPPTDEPELGATGPNGGIINEIEYSYTDQNNYLINVVEGPICYGDFAGMSGGIYYKRTEDITTKGVIIQDAGNNVQFKVSVDGYGVITCINGCGEVLANRDRVTVTIHNNPVEE